MPTIRATLPVPPSVNHYYEPIVVRDHISHKLRPEGMAYRWEVWDLINRLEPPVPLRVSLVLVVRVWFASGGRVDLDNRLKPLLDAVGIALGFDDCRIAELHAYKAYDRAKPRVEIELNWGEQG